MIRPNTETLKKSKAIQFISLFRSNDFILPLVGIVILVVLFASVSPFFLTALNIQNMLVQSSILMGPIIGMTLVIITKELDLSVASNLTLSGVVAALLIVNGQNILVSILAALLVGLLIGFFNGFFSAYVGIPAFMVTLAMQSIARGAALFVTQGGQVAGLPEEFIMIGKGSVSFIPIPVFVALVLITLFHLFLSQTNEGRKIYAVGGNPEAAIILGLPWRKSKLIAYTVCGALSALSGVILTARLTSASPVVAYNWELTVITAAVLGGTSFTGGKGTIVGSALGGIFLGLLSNGLSILDVSPFYLQLISGTLILIVVLIDRIRS